jgi:hypothetical protein
MAMTYPTDPVAAAQIEPSLRPGEQLLWCGRHATVVFEPFGSYYVTDTAMTGPPMADTGVTTMSTTRRRVAPGSLTFDNVADPEAMLAAINQAKAHPLQDG